MGIAGLTTAYLLSNAGKKVAVAEDGYIGSGENRAHYCSYYHALDDRYFNIEKMFGIDGAILAAESHGKAIDFIESVIDKEKIDCDFERLDGYLFLDPSDNIESLRKEYEATHRVGLPTELVQRAPLHSFDTGQCLRFPNQAQFHPLKYLKGLSQAIANKGAVIFTETHVQEIGNDGVKTDDGFKIDAKSVVVATNAPIVDKVSKMYDKQIPYRTYAIGALVRKGAIPKALYWDTGDSSSKNTAPPYHYVRIQKLEDREGIGKDKSTGNSTTQHSKKNNSYDLLIVGGEDHKTGNENDIEERHNRLIEWTKQRFPIEDIVYRWSGQVMEPLDSLAFIGANPKGDRNTDKNNIYIATGDSGNGITHGTVAGMLNIRFNIGKRKQLGHLVRPI